jgi:hypothetical protein
MEFWDRINPIATIESAEVNDRKSAADCVCCLGYRIRSDVDPQSDLDSWTARKLLLRRYLVCVRQKP